MKTLFAADVLLLEEIKSLSTLFYKRRPTSFDIDVLSIMIWCCYAKDTWYICNFIPCTRKVKACWSRVHFGTLLKHLDAFKPSHTSWRLSHHQQLRHLPWPCHCLPSKLALPPAQLSEKTRRPRSDLCLAYAAIRSELWKSSMNVQRQKRAFFCFDVFWSSLWLDQIACIQNRYNHVNCRSSRTRMTAGCLRRQPAPCAKDRPCCKSIQFHWPKRFPKV